MTYLKIFTDFEESLALLEDAEAGRLFRAALRYAADGETSAFTGNERFLWPTLRQSIDREAETYARVSERNRKNRAGGKAAEAATSPAKKCPAKAKTPASAPEKGCAAEAKAAADAPAKQYPAETKAKPDAIPASPSPAEPGAKTGAEPIAETRAQYAGSDRGMTPPHGIPAEPEEPRAFRPFEPLSCPEASWEDLPLPEDWAGWIADNFTEEPDSYAIPDETDALRGAVPGDGNVLPLTAESEPTVDEALQRTRSIPQTPCRINGFDVSSRVVQDKDKDKDSKETLLTESERKRRWRPLSQGTSTVIPSGESLRRGSRRADIPRLEEVRAFCAEQGLSVDAEAFFRYYEAGDWRDSAGHPVRSWRQKLLSWNSHGAKRTQSGEKHPSVTRPGMGADAPYAQTLLTDEQLDALLIDLDSEAV